MRPVKLSDLLMQVYTGSREECMDFILCPFILQGNDSLYVKYGESSPELEGGGASGEISLANFGSKGPQTRAIHLVWYTAACLK